MISLELLTKRFGAQTAVDGLSFMTVSLISGALAGITTWAWSAGWFWWLVLGEAVVACGIYVAMRASMKRVRWGPME